MLFMRAHDFLGLLVNHDFHLGVDAFADGDGA